MQCAQYVKINTRECSAAFEATAEISNLYKRIDVPCLNSGIFDKHRRRRFFDLFQSHPMRVAASLEVW